MERIDKILAASLGVSRRDAAVLIKKAQVLVNGAPVRSVNVKCDELNDEILVDGKAVSYSKFVYIMMNKPKGVISASDGKGERTVIDLLPDDMRRKGLFPAGRLDKDTTGFMLITDDGDFSHRILSPKKHVPKTYIAVLDKPFSEDLITEFKNGVELKDGKCQPADLEPANSDYSTAKLTINEGKYHQVKRMFAKYGLKVLELKRVKIGKLLLDNRLAEGECRYLTKQELEQLEST